MRCFFWEGGESHDQIILCHISTLPSWGSLHTKNQHPKLSRSPRKVREAEKREQGYPELCQNLLNYFYLLSYFVALLVLACIFCKGPDGGVYSSSIITPTQPELNCFKVVFGLV